jgi:heat shock protein HtpX
MSNQLKTVLLLGLLSVLLVGIGGAAAPGMMHFFLFLAVLMNIGSYFYSDKIVLKMQRARPLSENEAPELHAMVRELAHNAQIPMPRLYIIPEQQPNAFATGRNP